MDRSVFDMIFSPQQGIKCVTPFKPEEEVY
jgi:hypothetical protein